MGQRFSEERKRLGLSQQKLADKCAAGRKSIARYERGENVPGGEFLASFAAVGADVLYILTGNRAALVHPTSHDEAILMLYHSISEEQQRDIYKSLEEKNRLNELERTARHVGNSGGNQ